MNQLTTQKLTLGLLGARGYVGNELLKLINSHPFIELTWLSSRALCGKKISDILPECQSSLSEITIETLCAEDISNRNTDIIVLALPNGVAAPYVKAIEQVKNNDDKKPLIIDLSADYRFDQNWLYMIPEIIQKNSSIDFQRVKKISNPGCYATAMQLVLMPLQNELDKIPSCFGVSGYSGAGTKPSDKNNPLRLKDNFLPYAPVNHLHEKEVTFQFKNVIQFTPHVANFFRGINMTVHLQLSRAWTEVELMTHFNQFYKDAILVKVQKNIPEVHDVQNKYHAVIGGISLKDDGRQATIFCVLDNLLKGAASQALQNINLVCGFEELTGILPIGET